MTNENLTIDYIFFICRGEEKNYIDSRRLQFEHGLEKDEHITFGKSKNFLKDITACKKDIGIMLYMPKQLTGKYAGKNGCIGFAIIEKNREKDWEPASMNTKFVKDFYGETGEDYTIPIKIIKIFDEPKQITNIGQMTNKLNKNKEKVNRMYHQYC